MDYYSRLSEHLSMYKEFNIGIMGDDGGTSASPVRRADVLPNEYRDLNILASYRRSFRHLTQADPMVRLQGDFHHLNSSQALCYNLFFPFVQDEGKRPILLEALGCSLAPVVRTGFEYSFGASNEETFDFLIRQESGKSLYFDVKLSEQWFGPSYLAGISPEFLAASTRADIIGLITGTLLKSPEVAKLIVLLKKMAYVASSDCRHLFCIFPRANKKLVDAMVLLQNSLYETNRSKLSVCYLEDFVRTVLRLSCENDHDLHRHYRGLEKKYVID